MKTTIISLLVLFSIGLASAKQETNIENKGVATDFILDNILKPLLNDLKNNSLSFLLNQLLGKREIDTKGVATDFILDNILKPLLNDLKNNSLSFLMNQLLGKRDLDQKGLSTDFRVQFAYLIGNFLNLVKDLIEKSVQYLNQSVSSQGENNANFPTNIKLKIH